MRDFLEQLAELEVPPPPVDFDDRLHDRVNRTLIVVQLVELVSSAFPWAVLELGKALAGFVQFTVTGKYDLNKRKKRNQ